MTMQGKTSTNAIGIETAELPFNRTRLMRNSGSGSMPFAFWCLGTSSDKEGKGPGDERVFLDAAWNCSKNPMTVAKPSDEEAYVAR